jgi:putative oxidoreductase
LRSSRPSNRAALIAFKAVESCGSDREGNVLSRSQDGALLLGRLLVAALFLPSGLNKLVIFSSFAASLSGKGVPFPALAAAVIVAAEVLGPLALIGLWPRWTAVVLIGFSAVTLWLTHRHAGVGVVFRPRQNREILESLAIIGGLLLYFASGPGSWSRASLRGG